MSEFEIKTDKSGQFRFNLKASWKWTNYSS